MTVVMDRRLGRNRSREFEHITIIEGFEHSLIQKDIHYSLGSDER